MPWNLNPAPKRCKHFQSFFNKHSFQYIFRTLQGGWNCEYSEMLSLLATYGGGI
jgi:hypothetical protein